VAARGGATATSPALPPWHSIERHTDEGNLLEVVLGREKKAGARC